MARRKVSDDEPEVNDNPFEGEAAPDDSGGVFGTGENAPVFGEPEPEPDTSRQEARPQPGKGTRASAANLLTFAWGGLGMAMERSPDVTLVPTGRVLQFQAPLAGIKLDALLAYSWLDTALQPLIKTGEKVEGFGALAAFPLLTLLYTKNPEMGPLLQPMLRQLIQATLMDLAPVLRKQKSDARRAAASVDDITAMFPDGMIPKGADPVDVVLEMLFADPNAEPEPEAEL